MGDEIDKWLELEQSLARSNGDGDDEEYNDSDDSEDKDGFDQETDSDDYDEESDSYYS